MKQCRTASKCFGAAACIAFNPAFVNTTSKPRASFSHCSRAGFSASGQFNRSDFGISFNAPIGLDGMLVSDKVSIE